MIQKLEAYIRQNRLNKYTVAVMTDDCVETVRLQPCNRCNDSYSVAKAFTMTAIGMLQDDGILDVRERVTSILLPYMPKCYDKAWDSVTIEDALTHRIGFDKGFLDIDVEDMKQYGTKDYLSIVLSHPLTHAPSTVYSYTDAAYYLLSRIVTQKTGRLLDDLLMERLFAPLDFAEVAWSHCPQGYPIGATGLYISTEDMVKLAWLYMDGGKCNGKRIVSDKWTAQALSRYYEFKPIGSTGLIGKGGMYGQMALFTSAKRFAVAWHGFDDAERDMALIDYIASLA